MENSLKSLSMDYLNLLINGSAFCDVTFSVEGRLVPAHRCVLAARSQFFRTFFTDDRQVSRVVPVNSVTHEVFLIMLQFLYSGQVSVVPQSRGPRGNCSDRGCRHENCTAAVELAIDTMEASRAFGVDHLAVLAQKQLCIMVEKASIENVLKVLIASRKHEMHQLWTTCINLVAKSGLPQEILSHHLPTDIAATIDHLRAVKFPPTSVPGDPAHKNYALFHHEQQQNRVARMRRALDASDVELVKLMVMGEGLNLDDALALHYAVESCSREVVKALLELGAADVNCPAGPTGRTPLHVAAEKVCPDMVAVLLDHHADPNARSVDGVTPLDVLRSLTSEFLFRGALPGIEPNKLRLCLELVQSAAVVISREEGKNCGSHLDDGIIYDRRSGLAL